jgi:hypothetical protein
MPSPAIFPGPYGLTIRIWEGLYRRGPSGWFCDHFARTTRDHPSGSCAVYIREPNTLHLFNARDKYVELSTVFASPYLWAGLWFLGENGGWHLYRSWTNRWGGPGGLPWGGDPL